MIKRETVKTVTSMNSFIINPRLKSWVSDNLFLIRNRFNGFYTNAFKVYQGLPKRSFNEQN